MHTEQAPCMEYKIVMIKQIIDNRNTTFRLDKICIFIRHASQIIDYNTKHSYLMQRHY